MKKIMSLLLAGLIVVSFPLIYRLGASAEFISSYSWEFNTDGNKENWVAHNQITGFAVSGGYASGTITGSDSQLWTLPSMNLDITNTKVIKIKMKNSSGSQKAALYFLTDTDKAWNSAKYISFNLVQSDSGYTEYTLDLSANTAWTGTLYELRFDTMNDSTATGSFSIDYFRIGTEAAETTTTTTTTATTTTTTATATTTTTAATTTTTTATPTTTTVPPSYVFNPAVSWEFNTDGNKENWLEHGQINDFGVSGGYASGTITGSDSQLWTLPDMNLNITNTKIIKIKMKNSSDGQKAALFFLTNMDKVWNGTKCISFNLVQNDTGYTEYTLDLSANTAWTGTLFEFRLDPVNDSTSTGSFSIDYIKIGSNELAPTTTTQSDTTTTNATTTTTAATQPPVFASAVSWEFNTVEDMEGWHAQSNNMISSLTVNDGYLNGTISGNDSQLLSNHINANITDKNIIKMKIKNTSDGAKARIYFVTNADMNWNGAKSIGIVLNAQDSNYTEYTVDMSGISGWTGVLYQMRIDPIDESSVTTGSFSIDYIRIGSYDSSGTTTTQTSTSTYTTGTNAASNTTYYVSSSMGSDSNNGTSPETPWKTLAHASTVGYTAGNSLLLKCGDTWTEQLILTDSAGTKNNPFIVGSYGTGAKPIIKRTLQTSDVCIVANNLSYVKITGLNISNAAMGIQLLSSASKMNYDVTIENCDFRDIYGVAQWKTSTAFPGAQFSSGILMGANIDGLYIVNCTSYNCSSLTGSQNGTNRTRRNINIIKCTMISNRQYGMVVSEAKGGVIDSCVILNNGTQDCPVGSTSIMLGNLTDYTVKNCEIGYQQRFGTNPDGCGIDYEVNCKNVTVTGNYIHHSAGVGVFFYRHMDAGIIHYNNNVTNNIFEKNNQNPLMTGVYGSEIYLMQPNSNTGGTISGNKYYQFSSFVKFINAVDESVTKLSDNQVIDYTANKSWDFSTDGDSEGWSANQITDSGASNDYFGGTISGTTPYITSPANLSLDLKNNKVIKIALKNSTSATSASLRFITNSDKTWDSTKQVTFSVIPNATKYSVYIIDLSNVSGWTGTLNQLRLIPANGVSSGNFSMDYLYLGGVVTEAGDQVDTGVTTQPTSTAIPTDSTTPNTGIETTAPVYCLIAVFSASVFFASFYFRKKKAN